MVKNTKNHWINCATEFCRNKADRGRYCYKCISRKRRAKNPMRAAYENLRQNAKRREKEFDLTFEQFSNFAIKYDYLKGKGRRGESYSIDRIDNSKGYTLSNIRVITLSENSKKGGKMCVDAYWNPEEGKMVFNTIKRGFIQSSCVGEPDENLPF